jgi:D-alanyl-D-alanine carboxypeptidase
MAKSRKSTSRKSKSSKSESSKSRSPNTRSAGKRAAATGRPISPARRIDTRFKGLTQALEPAIDANPADLDPTFRAKVNAALVALQTANIPFKLVEGFRTVDRQQWLYGSGRPSVTPFGRPGKIVTNADGVTNKSKHQGAGTAGTGLAADCYPMQNGRVYVPPGDDPIWDTYATAVEAQGLVAGFRWTKLKDSPHCEAA